IQAAVLRVKLKHLDEWTAARQRNAGSYRRLFAEAGVTADGGWRTNSQPPAILLPTEQPDHRHIYNQFVIRVARRDELMAHLKSRQIGCEVYYPVPMHMQECFVDLDYRPGDFPVSEQAAQETLALPIYPELTEAQQCAVVGAVDDFLGQAT